MRTILLLTVITTALGCNGQILPTSNQANAVYCFGNPDSSGGVVCVPEGEVWSCETMPNGDVKCVHTPDGQAGWSCSEQDGQVVCTKDVADAFGGAGWDCVSVGDTTTCTSVGGGPETFVPPGGGSAVCTTNEFGVECVDQSSGDDVADRDSKGEDGKKSRDKPGAGSFRTQTPGGWGAPAAGDNPGAYRDANFAGAFPNGLTVGCNGGHTALFTSAKAIETFLPAGGTPGALGQDYVDPTTTAAGVLAGQVVALTLAVGFDAYDADFGTSDLAMRHLIAVQGPCAGMTLGQILDVANNVLGGCAAHLDASTINGCVDSINNNFVDGSRDNGFLVAP